MAQNNDTLRSIESTTDNEQRLLNECEMHESDSYTWLGTMRNDWQSKESIILGDKPLDALSQRAKAKIVDQSLSSLIIERASRVCANLPSIEAFAETKNSLGRSMLMNTAIKRFQNKANEEGSHLLKLRHLNIGSHTYGSMFGIVPWRVNNITGYIGPELLPIPIRDVRPQPGRRTIDKMDWFNVRSKVSLNWLKQQDPGMWKNIDSLIAEYKDRKDPGASGRSSGQDTRSYAEESRFPSIKGDQVFPDIEIFTEYRQDMWITWAPRNVQNKNSRPWILRIVKNPYAKGFLPVVVKHAFPLMDSIIGLGDVERGKTLQFAKNALINLYFDGVKMAIFPPLHINLNEVDPTSIKWGAAEKWYMNHPNEDVQIMNMQTTQWLSTFQSTYGFLTTQIQNLSGSTSQSETPGAEPTLGKTPDAVKSYQANQSARDEWDTFMMEDLVKQVYDRWIPLISNKMETKQTFRIFGSEIKDLQKSFPDENILTVFDSKNRGSVTFNREQLHDRDPITDEVVEVDYSYDLEPGSMQQSTRKDEGEVATEMLQELTENPELLKEIRQQGGDINILELYKRRMMSRMKDWDKILIEPNSTNDTPQNVDVDGDGIPDDTQGASADVNGQSAETTGQIDPASQTPESAGAQPKPLVNYKDAPDDVKRQMEQKEGYQPSQMVTAAQVIDEVAKGNGQQTVQPVASTEESMPSSEASSNGVQSLRDPHLNQTISDVLGGINGIPPVQ